MEPPDSPYPALDPSDPYARAAQTFPILSDAMTARLAAFGSDEDVPDGATLFERGERSVDFFLCVRGGIEILETDDEGERHIVHTHEPGQFTGELDLFNDRKILVTGRALPGSRVVRVKRSDFRRLIAAEPDVGEIIMRAFILRRVGLMLHGQGGVTLVGPGHAASTARIETFLTRNGYPHRRIDTEVDTDAGGFLECFEKRPVLSAALCIPM